MNPEQEAKELLLHYFRRAGVIDNVDHIEEVEKIVDLIIEAAVAEVCRLMREPGHS